VHLQHLHLSIDRVDQADLLRQAMHRTDAAAREPAHAVAVLILNIARCVHRSGLRGPRPSLQPSLNPSSSMRDLPLPSRLLVIAFASRLVSTRLHSKCPS
jgi:hypothetical protein